jgi:diguanylate cyclase (GGDEF)-like protein
VLFLALLVRLLAGLDARLPALRLLAGASALWLVYDTIYALVLQYGSYDQGLLIDALWLLGFVLLDLDQFKRFNDQYGHQAGDRLLKSATAAWSATLRTTDLLCRYGGEEFSLLMAGATNEQAVEVLERLRAVTPQQQTFSAGLACWDGQEISEELVARADHALYQAKDAGRDRILVAAGPA